MVFGLLMTGIGVWIVLFSLNRFTDDSPQVVIGSQGIDDRRGKRVIPWKDIRSVRLDKRDKAVTQLVLLVAVEGGQEMEWPIDVDDLDHPPDKILEMVKTWMSLDPPAPPPLGIMNTTATSAPVSSSSQAPSPTGVCVPPPLGAATAPPQVPAARSWRSKAKMLCGLLILALASGGLFRACSTARRSPSDQPPQTEMGQQFHIERLTDADPEARAKAAEALGKLRNKANAAVSRLNEVVRRDQSPRVRRAAAVALGQIGADAAEQAPFSGRAVFGVALDPCLPGLIKALLGALEDNDEEVRQAAAAALARVGAGELSPFVRALEEDTKVAVFDANGAWTDRSNKEVTKEQVLRDMGEAGKPLLFQVLQGEDRSAWKAASIVLTDRDLPLNGAETEMAVRIFEDVLGRDSAATIRAAGATALGRLGSNAANAAPALCRTLKDKSVLARRSATWALGRVAPKDRPVASALAEALKDTDAETRLESARALAEAGPHLKPLVPALCHALKDDDPHVRAAAAAALGQTAPKGVKVVKPLIETVADGNIEVQVAVIDVLAKFGPAAQDAVGPLLDLQKPIPPSPILTHFPDKSRAWIEAAQTESERARAHWAALRALANIAPRDSRVVGPIIDTLDDAGEEMSREVGRVLRMIGKPAVKQLIQRLSHRQFEVRLSAAIALGEIGPDAREAVPALRQLAASDEADQWGVRGKIKAVLEMITRE
jgi:HEAT repeat protein